MNSVHYQQPLLWNYRKMLKWNVLLCALVMKDADAEVKCVAMRAMDF